MRITFLIIILLSLAACSSMLDIISPAEVKEPAELQEFTPQVTPKTVWGRPINSNPDYLNLRPVLHQGRLYVAGSDGEVSALNAANGEVVWQIGLDAPLSAGPGVGEGLVLLGTSDADVIALDLNNGQQRWRSRVSSEVLASPVAALGRVVVRTVDGKLIGLGTRDGAEQWRYARSMPTLSLRGAGSPVLNNQYVLSGMDGGKLVALDVRNGQQVWESTIAVPLGRSELARLVDIDADPLVHNGNIYVNSYQGGLASLGEFSGTLLWRREFSSYSKPAAEGNTLYAADAEGVVWAFDNRTGEPLWQQDVLQRRQLSDVAVLGDFVVVGDYAGYVHFLLRQDGSQAARVRVGDAAIRKGMLSADGILYVQNDDGQLKAFGLDR